MWVTSRRWKWNVDLAVIIVWASMTVSKAEQVVIFNGGTALMAADTGLEGIVTPIMIVSSTAELS
jgi:hypothetical protein